MMSNGDDWWWGKKQGMKNVVWDEEMIEDENRWCLMIMMSVIVSAFSWRFWDYGLMVEPDLSFSRFSMLVCVSLWRTGHELTRGKAL